MTFLCPTEPRNQAPCENHMGRMSGTSRSRTWILKQLSSGVLRGHYNGRCLGPRPRTTRYWHLPPLPTFRRRPRSTGSMHRNEVGVMPKLRESALHLLPKAWKCPQKSFPHRHRRSFGSKAVQDLVRRNCFEFPHPCPWAQRDRSRLVPLAGVGRRFFFVQGALLAVSWEPMRSAILEIGGEYLEVSSEPMRLAIPEFGGEYLQLPSREAVAAVAAVAAVPAAPDRPGSAG
mmetsp:Transcript_22658/g.49767  ORF Transcript_22658/g.49767 Transcript_22658/m.49767 type:complete len:231 (-) Transcript_22658:612-1304(-)